MKYSSIESEYLIQLIKCALKEQPLPSPPENINWDKLIKLSKQQQVYSVISVLLDSTVLPPAQAEELNAYSQSELIRLLAMKSEFEQFEKELEDNQIKFMPLKGCVLREYYPQQKMRQMSDMDILYDYSKRDTLVKIMKSHGYRLTASCENSDDFFKNPFYTFEWHRELFFEESDFCPHFDLWANAVADKENRYKYHIEETEHFIYTICHMYKHYATNGCGVRFLCDIYLMLKKCCIHLEQAFDKLEEIGISDFSKDAVSLAYAVFDDNDVTDKQQKMLDFMLSNGVYGNMIVDYSQKLDAFNGSKFKYLLDRVFPSKKKMKADYRILEKKPYLLPAYYIIRLCSKMKYNSKAAKQELKEIKKIK